MPIRPCADAVVVHELSHSSPPTDDPSNWWGLSVICTIRIIYIHLGKSRMQKRIIKRIGMLN